jgi:hypothetical protein
MTELKIDSEQVKRLRKRTKGIGLVSFLVIFVGLAIFLIAFMEANQYSQLEFEKKYLTDPNIPVSQWENATWTISHKQIHSEQVKMVLPGAIGLAIVGFGAGFGFTGLISPSPKELHKMGCRGEGKQKYCPECGLKLSELKERED